MRIKDKNKEELIQQITDETALIDTSTNLLEVQDAHWRRRMAKSALSTLGASNEERNADLNATARIG